MKYQSVFPWLKIQDYLLELGTQQSIPDLFAKSVERLHELIPYDVTAGLFSEPGSCIYDIREDQQKLNSAYNNYYAPINPIMNLDVYAIKWLDWREFQHTEFVTDFIYPQSIRYGLAFYSPQTPITISIQRSHSSPNFKDRDYEILTIITPHLNNIYSYLNKIFALEAGYRQAAELARGNRLLSKREVEVAALLCQRLTLTEIAAKMMLSPRTVETHVENIKDKLGVRNRRELLAKLLKSG